MVLLNKQFGGFFGFKILRHAFADFRFRRRYPDAPAISERVESRRHVLSLFVATRSQKISPKWPILALLSQFGYT
jgi:hypothetical protein